METTSVNLVRRRPQYLTDPSIEEEYQTLQSTKAPTWKRILDSYLKPCKNAREFGKTLLSFFPYLLLAV
ncbi:hypothetical protein M3Y97_01074500 [Aphelenchoides bicaudatus]|nr:hypothetical protein M3Y97_01074500 [Aphelenchoides bicaudatus]